MIFNKLTLPFLIVFFSLININTTFCDSEDKDTSLVIIERIDQLDGIYDRIVDFSFQSSDGFLWLATQNGLYVYDGSYLEYVDLGIPFENLMRWVSITEDDQENLWLHFYDTIDGINKLVLLNRVDLFNIQVVDFSSRIDDSDEGESSLFLIVESSEQGVIGLFRNGELVNFKYLPERDIISEKLIDKLDLTADLSDMFYLNGAYILVFKNGEVKYCDLELDRKFLIHAFDDKTSINVFNGQDEKLKVVGFGNEGNNFFGKIIDFDPSTGDITESTYDFGSRGKSVENSTRKVFFDPYNNEYTFLVGNYVDYVGESFSKDKTLKEFYLRNQKRRFISHEIYLDKDTRGISTRNGFYIVKRKKSAFHSLNSNNELFINNSIRRFISINDTLMVSEGYSGVVFFDQRTFLPINNHPILEKIYDRYGFKNGTIYRVIDLDDEFLLFFDRQKFLLINKKTFEFLEIDSGVESKFLKQDIWSVNKFHGENKFLISCASMLMELDTDRLFLDKVALEYYNEFQKFEAQIIYQFLELDTLNSLIGTSYGLFHLNQDKGLIKQYEFESESFPSINNEVNIHYIHQITDDIYYLATNSNGLIKYSLEEGVLEQVVEHNGKKIEAIHFIYETEDGTLFLATNDKLLAYNPVDGSSYVYFVNDGLTISEFNRQAYFVNQDSSLFLGGINGAVKFKPADFSIINQNEFKGLLLSDIEWFDIKNLEYNDIESYNEKDEKITLQHNEYSIRISLNSISFGNGTVNYYHKLASSGKVFEKSDNNIIYLDKLNYGEDTLQLYADYNFGSSKSEMLNIPIFLKKPFYLQNLFFIILGSILIVIIYVIMMVREQNSNVLRQKLEELVEERTTVNRKQAVELEELTKLKDKFFINISHELKTPLSLIKGPIEKLSFGSKLPAAEKVLLDMANSNIQRLSELIKEILDLSKLELGKQEVSLSHLDIVVFIKDRISQFNLRAETKKVNISFDTNKNTIYGLFDRKMVHTVISNLIDNSLRHAKGISELSVSVNIVKDRIEILIKDNGHGISENKLKYLFDRFQTTSSYESGSSLGIGLAISKEFADLMGGSLSVTSKKDVGTTFKFLLPLINSEQIDDEHIKNGLQLEIQDQIVGAERDGDFRHDILLVEDNRQLAIFIELLLKDKYNVTIKYNGQEAWDYLNEAGVIIPQLIISDIMMPKMDGFEFLELMKNNKSYADIGFLFLSARDSKEDILKALRIGVEDYLSKPFLESELLVVVENLLTNYRVRESSKVELNELALQSDGSKAAEPHETINLEEGLPLADKEFLEQLDKYIEENIERLEFTIEDLSYNLAISSRQLRRKIQKLTGFTPNQYIRKYKMNVARKLLETRSVYSVKELSYKLGFKSSAHFAKLFKNHFGRNPSDFV